ncbi:DUF1801 domain-containing protein [Flavobacterium sp.]|uniref:DUF1801 domain-containing protein n=1 Tax=Flavobacterium sp. TaxID=239 RepID=UPI003F69CA82
MTSKATSPQQYIDELQDVRVEAITKLRKVINENLPKGFKEEMSYGMIGYVVPHEIYPDGYHCSPDLPLPFMSFASQKNSINFYHMGIYGNPSLLNWFTSEYPKHCKAKLDMGKSCIRFKKMDQIPFELLGELVKKVSVKEWIETYETHFKR